DRHSRAARIRRAERLELLIVRAPPISGLVSRLATACALLALAAAPAHADTLKDALVRAYKTNPTLEAARANQRANDENVPIERADALPSLSGSGTYNEFVYDNSSTPGPARSLGGQVSLAVPIYSGGGTKNAIRGA